MNRNRSIALTILSVLIAVGGVSFAVKATQQKKELEKENGALRQQLAGLQTEPESNKMTPAPAPNPVATNTLVTLQTPNIPVAPTEEDEQPPEQRRRESWDERMARMKEEDPEGYAERIKQREEFREKIKYDLATRTATFMDLDTASMSEKEFAAHEQLVDRMGTIWELMEQMQNPEESNREVMGQLFREAREARPLMEQERATMFRLLGEDLGYEGKDAKEFATHIDSIISATTLQPPHGSGRGRGGR